MRLAIASLLLCVATFCQAAPPSVELELLTAPGLPLDAPQKWIAMLKDVKGVTFRIRSGGDGDKTGVRKSGSDDRPHYAVTGIITSGNVLRLPGASIKLHDKTALTNYIAKLQDGGESGVRDKQVMYGLTAKQMLEVHDHLKGIVNFDTKGEKTGDIVNKLADSLDLEIKVDSSASSVGRSDEPVLDELNGLSYGTALAAVLRPLGFVVVPQKKLGEKLHLLVTDAKNVEKPWPVGWPATEAPIRLAPKYAEQTNAEINDYVLEDALLAIQKRVQLPMVFDYNNIARQRVDLKMKVSLKKKGKKSYITVVDEILYQARLSAEMRIDEAEKPFLWITTVRQ